MVKIFQADPLERYEVKKTLFKTWCRKKRMVARKDIHTHATYIMASSPIIDRQGNPNTVKETVKKLLTLSHPKITSVLEAYEWNGFIHWIMEDWHSKRDTRGLGINFLTEEKIAETVQALCSAISYLHRHGIVHGCLAYDDIGFYLEDEHLNFMLTDFGIGHHVDEQECSRMMDKMARKGTPPEARKKAQFTKAGDVYSIGVVAYYLLTNDHNPEPLVERLGFDLKKALCDTYKHKKISETAQDFMIHAIQVNASQRMDSTELLEHPWFKIIQKPPVKPIMLDKIAREMGCFVKQSRFRVIASKVLVAHHLHSSLDEYRQLFNSLDNDSNGFLTYHEFYQAMRGRVTASENFDFTVMIDSDENRVIDYDEFLGFALAMEGGLNLTTIIEGFYSLDIDSDGFISPQDLAIKTDKSQEECLEIIAEAIQHDMEDNPELVKVDLQTFVKMFYILNWREWIRLKVGMKKDIIGVYKNPKSTNS